MPLHVKWLAATKIENQSACFEKPIYDSVEIIFSERIKNENKALWSIFVEKMSLKLTDPIPQPRGSNTLIL
jgi:hypothetical protein